MFRFYILFVQCAEMSLPNAVNSSITHAVVLFLIQIHGSHMILGCCVLSILISYNMFFMYYDNLFELLIIYWHLIEAI